MAYGAGPNDNDVWREDVEDDDDEYDEYDEEEEEDEQEQMSAAEKLKFELEEKILKNKLKHCLIRISKDATKLTADEKKTVKKAKNHPNLEKELKKINAILIANKVKLVMKTMSSSPVLIYVGIGLLILLLIICVVAIIGSIMPYLFPEDNAAGSSAFGVSGKDFFGIRTVYKDDEKATASIIEDYVEVVEKGIEEVKSITTISSEGSDVNVTLQINLPTPQEDYDYSNFDEATFKTEYATLYTTVFDIAKVVYRLDNSQDYTQTSLVECVDGILYFGFSQTIMADIKNIITNSIVANTTITAQDGATIDKENEFKPKVDETLAELYAQEKFNIRAEKLFVKDYIFESEDDHMEGVSKENYVAFIFMPKKNVTFKKFSFSAGGADLSEFTISLTNDGNEIRLTKDESNFSTDENVDAFIYSSSESLNEGANVFADINTSNLEALSAGLSLFDIVESVENYSMYLETTSENSIEYFTIKKNGVVANLSNSEAFNFVEFETLWR